MRRLAVRTAAPGGMYAAFFERNCAVIRKSAVAIARAVAPRPEYTFALGMAGRLGNQLHQIAATYGIAADRGTQPLFRRDWAYRSYFSLPDSWFASRFAVIRARYATQAAVVIPADWRIYLQNLDL